MSKTKIEWATHTANWLAGCTKASPACTHCYAETMSRRMQHLPHAPDRYEGVVDANTGRWTGRVRYDAEALTRAFHGLAAARAPRRVFVNSMSDTFHADAPAESLRDLAAAIFGVADLCAGGRQWPHTLMLLTKRPENLLAWQRQHFPARLPAWVWVGCTVEDQRRADERVPVLLEVETRGVRFLSCEPLLGPVDLRNLPGRNLPSMAAAGMASSHAVLDALTAGTKSDTPWNIGWVIAGGESGRHARPSHPEWFRSLRDQCVAAGVAFHFKQWGEWAAPPTPAEGDVWMSENGARLGPWLPEDGPWFPRGAVMRKVGKRIAGRMLDGRTWDEVPRV